MGCHLHEILRDLSREDRLRALILVAREYGRRTKRCQAEGCDRRRVGNGAVRQAPGGAEAGAGEKVMLQTIKTKKPDHSEHIWRPLPDRKFKCCTCGGVTDAPTETGVCETYEPLTDEDRRLCPKR